MKQIALVKKIVHLPLNKALNMTLKEKYFFYIALALAVFCAYLCYVNYHKNTTATYDKEFYENRIDSLNTENMRLNNHVLFREKLDSIRLKKLDSLSVEYKQLFESREKLKNKITYYDTFKSADINASADSMRAILSEVGFH